MTLRLIRAVAKVQLRLTSRDIEHFLPIIVMPLQTLVSMAILVESGRADLAGYALSASLLMTVGQMAFFVSSEIVHNDRNNQVLELLVATPAPYVVILATRTLMLTSLGLFGFVEAWLIARFAFDVSVAIHHPWVLLATLLASATAGGGTAVLTAALFSMAREVRTLQNSINGPFYLLGGVLVPVTFLPTWVQPLSPLLFLYWAADLCRDSLAVPDPERVPLRLAALVGLGAAAALLGAVLMRRMLDQLRRSGRIGLA